MGTRKKSKKVKTPLWIRIIKYLFLTLFCIIVVIALVLHFIHYFQSHFL